MNKLFFFSSTNLLSVRRALCQQNISRIKDCEEPSAEVDASCHRQNGVNVMERVNFINISVFLYKAWCVWYYLFSQYNDELNFLHITWIYYGVLNFWRGIFVQYSLQILKLSLQTIYEVWRKWRSCVISCTLFGSLFMLGLVE